MRMNRKLTTLILSLVLTVPALAADGPALTGAEFEAFVTGKTFAHSEAGSRYGAEQYLPGRRVVWQDADGCIEGRWQVEAGLICFDYQGEATRWCWSYQRAGDGLVARLMDDPAAARVSLEPQDGALNCPAEPSLS